MANQDACQLGGGCSGEVDLRYEAMKNEMLEEISMPTEDDPDTEGRSGRHRRAVEDDFEGTAQEGEVLIKTITYIGTY